MVKKQFKKIYIEISNICNLNCSFCPSSTTKNHLPQIMSVKNFTHIIAQTKFLCEEIFLHILGEPLAHPSFSEIIKVCEDNNVSVQITTNGLLVSKFGKNALLSPSIRQINFSLQSFGDNFPEKNLEEYIIPILTFSSEILTSRPKIYINYRLWNLTSTSSEGNELILKTIESFYQIKISRNVDVKKIKSKKIIPQIYLHFDSRFTWPSLDDKKLGTKGSCYGLNDQLGILADGTVVPCCLDTKGIINLGNCLKTDLSSIINGPRAKAIKDGFLAGKLEEELCQRCNFVRRFSPKARAILTI